MAYKFDNSRINLALQKATHTKHVFIDSGILSRVYEIFEQCYGDQKAVIIADENTYNAAGKQVYETLLAHDRVAVEPYIFPSQPMLYAEYENILKLEALLKSHEGIPIAVGSGTINDLTKVASFRCKRPYLVVGTAASMDGYTSYGASITENGFKHTIACAAPYAVLIDLDVIANAPYPLTASGYGDVFGKVTAGADWIIADTLGIEPINYEAWSLVQPGLRDAIGTPSLLHQRDIATLGKLVEILILCGLAMQAIRSSRPASGSEHQFSHLWEMLETNHGAVSHGFKVGLGSIASEALYEQVMEKDLQYLDIAKICSEWPTIEQVEESVRGSYSDPIIADKAVEQSLGKYIDSQHLALRLEKIQETWPELKKRIKDQLLTASKAYRLLSDAGCPTHPNEIGHDLAYLKTSYHFARQIRSRYTIFDLAAETGNFEECVNQLFDKDGFWTKVHVK